jgi:hypothetical protein
MAPIVKSLGLASACVVSILVPLVLATNAAHASDPDESFCSGNPCTTPTGAIPSAVIGLPAASNPLTSFDISYVDPTTHTYVLADRSNFAVDVADTLTNTFSKFLIPTPPFAGNVAGGAGGPNGVILINGKLRPPPPFCSVNCGPVFGNGATVHLVWATDAPSPGNTGTSSIKVMDAVSGATVKVLNTLGVKRSDELCFVTLPSGDPDPANPYGRE